MEDTGDSTEQLLGRKSVVNNNTKVVGGRRQFKSDVSWYQVCTLYRAFANNWNISHEEFINLLTLVTSTHWETASDGWGFRCTDWLVRYEGFNINGQHHRGRHEWQSPKHSYSDQVSSLAGELDTVSITFLAGWSDPLVSTVNQGSDCWHNLLWPVLS